MEDLEERLKERIRVQVKQVIADCNLDPQEFQILKDEITKTETRRFYLHHFAAVSRTQERFNIKTAARYVGSDRTNFKRKVRTDGFDINELMEASHEITDIEISDSTIEKGMDYFHKEILVPSIMSPYLNSLLEKNDFNISAATREYGMDRTNFRRLLKQYGLSSRENAED